MNVFPRRRFYRGGLQISGLQTLWSRIPISISCNVALGEPNTTPYNSPVNGGSLSTLPNHGRAHRWLPPQFNAGNTPGQGWPRRLAEAVPVSEFLRAPP